MTSYSDCLAFGGDYPHGEGLSSPYHGYQELLGVLDPDTEAAVYGGNMNVILND